jgi:PAS domain S-box-containing protein
MSGPLLAVGAAAGIELLSGGAFNIPNPPALLLLIVVFSAFIGGLGSGLVTALIAWLSFLYFFSTPGHLFHYTDENLRRVVVWGVTTPLMAIMVGVLKARAERGVEVSREKDVLAEQMSGRHQAAQVLQESETRYRTLFESVPVGVLRTTPAGQILDANPAVVRLFGFPDRDALLATNITDLYFDPKERAWRAAQVARERTGMFEPFRMRRYDGTPVWVELSARATYDPQGRVLYYDAVLMDVTDRKHAEETRNLWAAIAESTDDAIVAEDLEGIIRSWNPGAERLYGYAAAEVVGRPVTLLAAPDRPDEIPRMLERLRRGQRIEHHETVRVRKDGSRIDVALTMSPVRDMEGNIIGTSGITRDISARKRHEEARNRLAAIVESSDDAILGTSLDGTIQSWNAGAEKIYGYTAAEVVGRSAALLAPPDRPHEIPGLLERVGRGERIQHFETVRMCKDGSRIDVSLTISPTRDAAGNIIGVSSTARDIEARKRHEEALRQSEERYRGLFNGIPIGLYRATSGGEILEANAAFLKMVGCPDMETLRAMDAKDLYVDPAVRQEWIGALEKEGVVSGFESQLRRRDGSLIWVAASARIVQDSSSGVSYLEGAAEDITERKQVQEAIMQAREADRANQAKSEFLSRMSHELRTPLNAILGFGQLLEMDSITSRQHEYVEDILKGGRHLLELINEVLDIARIEAGRMAISPEPVSVQQVVQESLSLIAPLAALENVRLEDGTAGIPEQFVLADRQRLKQVLLNLLSNGIKYNRSGGLVALSCESMPEGRLRIKVSDTGPGIPPDRLDRLFVPFERLGAEDTAIEGSGLGLALSKRLIEVMGGTMGVDSIVDRGTTFWVELALAESPAQQGREAMSGLTTFSAPPTAGTVLYIEDNLSNLKLVENLLELRPEVKIIAAMQGRLGLDLARQHRPEIILLDVHLPDMPGGEVLRRLQDAPETRHIPVVVISADATRAQIDRLLAGGARAYLTKPLDVKKLLELLDDTLTQKAPRDRG